MTFGISPDNINISPASFGYPSLSAGKIHSSIGEGTGFNQQLDLRVNGLKAAVSEPIGETAPTNAIKNFIHAVNEKEEVASEMRASILSGESNNLHQTMIATQEASVAFTLMLEMRNKVMETYQELMRLQI